MAREILSPTVPIPYDIGDEVTVYRPVSDRCHGAWPEPGTRFSARVSWLSTDRLLGMVKHPARPDLPGEDAMVVTAELLSDPA